MYDHELDARIDRIAHPQCGAFNLDQVRAAGGTDQAAAHRVELGRWFRLGPAVLALAASKGTFERQCWAAVLGEPVAAVGGFSAAVLRSFRGFTPGRPEIVVPPSGNARSPLARVHRYDAAAVSTVRGLRVTTAAQTVFDLAPRITVDRLEATVDDLLLTGRLTMDELEERLAVYETSRRAGLPVLRSVIGDRRVDALTPAVSELERRGDRILRRLRGRPRVLTEVSFPWLQGGFGRVDRYLPDDAILVEFDSRRWHARLADFDKDRWRDNQAIAAGVAPLRFTWLHVTRRPAEVLAIIEETRRVRRSRAA